MGKKQNLSHLTDEERDQIMHVLEKDFELRRAEKKLINEVHGELVKEKNRIAVLKEKDKFNENSCIICLERFGVLFHRKRKCHKCDLNVCSECSQAREKKKKGFICKVCSKEKAYKMLSNEWFYHSSHATDKNSGSSRIVRWLHKRPATELPDTDVDSGYNQSSCSSAGPGKTRPRLDSVFDINIKENVDEELQQQTSEDTSFCSSLSLEALSSDLSGNTQPGPHSVIATSDQPTEETVAETPHEKNMSAEKSVPKIAPRLQTSPEKDLNSKSALTGAPIPRKRNIKEHDLKVVDIEAIDRTKKAEESNFRVEFDKLLRDLYETLEDEDLGGLTSNTESPSYEDMMQTFKDNVTDILKAFTDKLQQVYERCGSSDFQDNPRDKVLQDVSKFIGAFIGENVNMTSEAVMSDFFAAVKDSSTDDSSFEELLAQAVVSKLFDSHYNEIRDALWASNDSNTSDLNREIYNTNDEACTLSSASDDDANDGVSFDDSKDSVMSESDAHTEIQELKEFVKNTSRPPRIEISAVDDSNLCEVNENTVVKMEVDRDEKREEFCSRYSALHRVHSSTLTLPDISCFDSREYVTDETDPDLLSLNLTIIPEETEEEVELDTEKKINWSFKGKGLSTNDSLRNPNEQLSPRGSLRMRVPIPDNIQIPKIGHRNIDQLSDFSDIDGSDDEENTFYANTSSELARIAKQRGKLDSSNQLSDHPSEESDLSGRFTHQQLPQRSKNDMSGSSDRNSEADVENSRQDIKLLEDLIPAEGDDPTFLVAPESVVIQEGEPVKFSCRVGGTGHIDVFWYREGHEVEELEDSSDVDIFSEGDKHSIVLYNVNKQMAGQYMCIAVNEKGKTIQYLALTVKDNKLELKKPEFLKGLEDVEVTEGQSVKFRVKVKGYPQPRVNWYKDGKLLKNSRLCRIEKFGNRDYILAIDGASMNDDAEYTVVAGNVAGQAAMSAQVIVEPKSDLPVRKQYISSTTTSGVSDSDSDRPLSYHSVLLSRNPRNVTSLRSAGDVGPPITSPTLISLSAKQRESQLNVGPVDRQTEFPEKQIETSASRRLLTDEMLDTLKVAEDIIEQEHKSPHSDNITKFKTEVPDSITLLSTEKQAQDPPMEELYLPDSLDDCELPEPTGQDLCTRDADVSDMQKHKHQALNKCSRDFEVPQTAKKKHETPSHEPQVSTRQNSTDRTDEMGHCSSHSFSQSTDSEVSLGSAQGYTSLGPAQGEVSLSSAEGDAPPEHDSEVHTSAAQHEHSKIHLLLPSVDKLKEVFSTEQDDDDIEAGTLKRVHSITARNVPKEQLESLRASHPNDSPGKILNVPEASLKASPQAVSESLLAHNKSSSDPSNKKLSSSSTNSASLEQRNSFKSPRKEEFTTLDGQKKPVLIYLKTSPQDLQQRRQQNQPAQAGATFEHQTEHLAPQSNQQTANKRPSTATKHPASNQSRQLRAATQPAGLHHGSKPADKTGPRIKGGCISARAAFWERKIAQGDDMNQEEFPDMVESNDT
ncbi:hypothetical protein BsWGS_18536 [Bradybaena similaris]